VAQLGHITPDIHRAGARLVVVGNGSPAMAKDFLTQHPLDAQVLVDPSLKVYAAAGLKRGVQNVLRLSTLKAGARAILGGHTQGLTKGDPWQQGGTFVVWPGGTVNFSHVMGFSGDLPNNSTVLAALARPPAGQAQPAPW